MKITKGRIKQFLNDTAAVSPAIATLILIVVAAVAAAAIGYMVQNSGGNVGTTLTEKNKDVQGHIVSDGSTTVLAVSLLAGPAFMQDNPSYSFSASGGGSKIGRLDVYTKKVDIGASSDPWPTTQQTENGIQIPARKDVIIQEAGPSATIWETKIGTSMIVMAGNLCLGAAPCDPITTINVRPGAAATSAHAAGSHTLTLAFGDIVAAYGTTTTAGTGTITVDTTPITFVQRSDESGTEETFNRWLLNDGNAGQLANAAAVHGEQGNQGIRDYIATHANTIGFLDVGFTGKNVNGNEKVIAGTMQDGATPAVDQPATTDTKGLDGTYDKASQVTAGGLGHKGLARDLYYYSYGTPTGAVKAYLDFVLSTKGQDQVHNAGYFSI